jgi:predicted TIM-barrel fold metal-dependent hydrolase
MHQRQQAQQQRHKQRIIHSWAAVDPFKGEMAIREAKRAICELGMLGFHFHPIMGHFSVNDRQLYPLFETIAELKAPLMIDAGTTGMGAGMPGGMGAKLRHAHPSAIDDLAAARGGAGGGLPELDDHCRAPRLALGR